MAKSNKQWQVNVQHFGTRKTKTINLAGGLNEAEARRGALLKAGPHWKVIGAHLVDHAAQTAMDRNVDLCCRVA